MWHTKATLIMCFITSKEKIHYVLSLPSENQQLNIQRVTLAVQSAQTQVTQPSTIVHLTEWAYFYSWRETSHRLTADYSKKKRM